MKPFLEEVNDVEVVKDNEDVVLRLWLTVRDWELVSECEIDTVIDDVVESE